jgi:valyl-tRNA synthetase
MLYQNDTLIAENASVIQKLGKLKGIEHVDQIRGLRLANSGREAWLDISAETLYQHQTNLELRLADMHRQIQALNARLENENYVKKAPAELVEESKKLLVEKQAIADRLIRELDVIK